MDSCRPASKRNFPLQALCCTESLPKGWGRGAATQRSLIPLIFNVRMQRPLAGWGLQGLRQNGPWAGRCTRGLQAAVPSQPASQGPGDTPPAFPLSWESKWRRCRRERSRRARSLPEASRFGLRVAQPGRMGQAQALGTCPAPCPQATRDTGLGLEAHGPGCGSWRGAETPDWCDKKKQVRAGHGQRLGGPQTQELPPTREGTAAGTAPVCIGS